MRAATNMSQAIKPNWGTPREAWAFSLTPALSRWEREKSRQSSGKKRRIGLRRHPEKRKRRLNVLPLPAGEGRGETSPNKCAPCAPEPPRDRIAAILAAAASRHPEAPVKARRAFHRRTRCGQNDRDPVVVHGQPRPPILNAHGDHEPPTACCHASRWQGKEGGLPHHPRRRDARQHAQVHGQRFRWLATREGARLE